MPLVKFYNLMFVSTGVVLIIQWLAFFLEGLLKKRKQKHKELFDTGSPKNGNENSKSTEQGPKSLEERLDTLECFLRCALTLLVIIGGGLFAGLKSLLGY